MGAVGVSAREEARLELGRVGVVRDRWRVGRS